MHFEVLKIPTVTKNGFLTKQMESVQKCTYGLELQGHSRKYRFKMKKIAKGQ